MAVTQIFEDVVERALEQLLREITWTSAEAPQVSSGMDDRALSMPRCVAFVEESNPPDGLEFTGVEVFDCTLELRSNQNQDGSPLWNQQGEHQIRWHDLLAKFLVDPINDTTFGVDTTSLQGMISATTVFINEGGRCDAIMGEITRSHELEDKIFISRLKFKGIFTGAFA